MSCGMIDHRRLRVLIFLDRLITFGGCVTLLGFTAVFRPMTSPGRMVVLLAVAVTLLASLRQFLGHRENQRLLRAEREAQRQLSYDATHDSLTGLANRALFRDRLRAALETGPATVVMVDLDDFTAV